MSTSAWEEGQACGERAGRSGGTRRATTTAQILYKSYGETQRLNGPATAPAASAVAWLQVALPGPLRRGRRADKRKGFRLQPC